MIFQDSRVSKPQVVEVASSTHTSFQDTYLHFIDTMGKENGGFILPTGNSVKYDQNSLPESLVKISTADSKKGKNFGVDEL